MIKCRHCGSKELSKNGIIGRKQRCKCKQCKRTTRENEYSVNKLKVLKGYLESRECLFEFFY